VPAGAGPVGMVVQETEAKGEGQTVDHG
jgi:hypothetical protein